MCRKKTDHKGRKKGRKEKREGERKMRGREAEGGEEMYRKNRV